MAKVTSRFSYPDALERKVIEQQYHDLEARKQLEKKLNHLDDKVKDTVMQLETARQELYKVRTTNKSILNKIGNEEADVKNLHTKFGSLKVKLGIANANLNTSNDDKEKLRSNLNEVQVEVARLEERLSALTSDLDRLRDPANPESNMSIRKHVVNDKKEIKRFKTEIENETNMLEIDRETVGNKDVKIRNLEKELGNVKNMLKECEDERSEAQSEEEFERQRKEELVREFQALKIDRKSYDERLKELKVKLGISVANQNVNAKYEIKIKREERSLMKTLTQIEKKVKDASGQLDVLKNQHKMSKTAMSINEYTKRNQMRKPSEGQVSLAQSGMGPIKFGSAAPKDAAKTAAKTAASSSIKGSMRSIPERLLASDGAKGSQMRQNGGKQKQVMTGNQQQNQKTARTTENGSLSQRSRVSAATGNQGDGSSQGTARSTGKKNSGQLVPPPKSKLQKVTPR